MPKAKKQIDNRFIRDGLNAYDMTQAELSRATGIPQDKLNKSIQNRRGVTSEEYRLIMAAFEAKKAGMPIFNPSLNRSPISGAVVSTAVEGDMNKEGGLWEIIGDLTRRIARLEQLLRDEEKEPASTGPQKRRKG